MRKNNLFIWGASSHDISGGILDRKSPSFAQDKRRIQKNELGYCILDESWWKQELPTEEELMEGLRNLSKVNYNVDFVITHCMSNRMQKKLSGWIPDEYSYLTMSHDVLTDYFEMLEDRLKFKHWFCGHYHNVIELDTRHTRAIIMLIKVAI